jgi:GNAT superfamily N-acetyltransferase
VWPAFTEAMHLLGESWRGQKALWSRIEADALALAPLDAGDAPRMRELIEKYRDLPMDLADAALVRVAERENLARLARKMVRPALASDIPDMQRIRHAVRENRLVSRMIRDREVQEAIENRGRGWVVEVSGEVVAFAIGDAQSGSIWALFVHPDHERKGYGRRLHDTMVDWLWSRGLDRLWLTTEPRTRAQRFYESAGWQLAGPTDGGELRYEIRRPTSKRATKTRKHEKD